MVRRDRPGTGEAEANRHGQQLFIADLYRQPGGRRPRQQPERRLRPAFTRTWPVTHRQLVLVDAPRDLARVGRRGLSPPKDPELAEFLDQATRDFAALHGWGASITRKTSQGIRILLGLQDTPGAPIKASDVELLVSIRRPVKPALQILTEAGMLEDDRVPRLDEWFAGKVAALPEQMAAELRIWFEVSHGGSTSAPRMRPRSPITIKVRLRSALPTLHSWAAAGHASLREISRNDVLAALPPSGNPRALLGAALKSIFSVLKSRKIVFVNPAARIATGKPEDRQPLPAEVSILRRLLKPDDPARAALTALLAFHALRSGQLRALLLTDVHDGRLEVDGRSIPLADLVRHRLAAYLDYRNRRWPNTANPHLFITQSTAIQTKPVTDQWIRYKLEGITAQAIREDRILHEAHVTDGDARRLGDLFGLSVKGATRYTATVDHPAIADVDTP